MGDPSNKAICKEVVSSVLPKLEGMAKWLFISADELKELQKLTVERNNIIGFAVSCVENKFAKSILALLINPCMGSPAFIARLIPEKRAGLPQQILVYIKLYMIPMTPLD